MKSRAIMTAAVATLLAFGIGAHPGFAKKNDPAERHDSGHHDEVTSGADFGDHVSDHAKSSGGFSGDMNPGNHKGYSTLK